MNDAVVAGAGLAGCEAAWQLANRGARVLLYEMKPRCFSPAHRSAGFAELVCSNSLRSDRLQNAVGLLKREMRMLNSLIMRAADAARVPAGGALAVDREQFSAAVSAEIEAHPNITVRREELTAIPDAPCIIATGPLTSEAFAERIAELMGAPLHFFDAAAPVVTFESIDMNRAFRGARYGRGEDDYINCPLDEAQYLDFYRALVGAQTVPLKQFEAAGVFEGCMPVETMAKRGERSLAFGPLKPVGLRHPQTGRRYAAVAQLRQEDAQGRLFNMVGFQTNLTFGEQERVFRMIPGLEHAEFVRLGVMHRNTYLQSPGRLTGNYRMVGCDGLYFAGQITGVEGYVESAASGLTAGIALARALAGREEVCFTARTALGALGQYVSGYSGKDFQPMHIAFGIIDPLEERVRGKRERGEAVARRALETLRGVIERYGLEGS